MAHDQDPNDDFLEKASGKQAGLVSELIGFLKANKKWWLAPIVIANADTAVGAGNVRAEVVHAARRRGAVVPAVCKLNLG